MKKKLQKRVQKIKKNMPKIMQKSSKISMSQKTVKPCQGKWTAYAYKQMPKMLAKPPDARDAKFKLFSLNDLRAQSSGKKQCLHMQLGVQTVLTPRLGLSENKFR